MAFYIALIVGIAVLALEIIGTYKELEFLRWLHLKSHTMIAKIVVAFLTGFIFFVIFTSKVSLVGQKISIIVFSGLLIFANLFLGKGKEEESKAVKD